MIDEKGLSQAFRTVIDLSSGADHVEVCKVLETVIKPYQPAQLTTFVEATGVTLGAIIGRAATGRSKPIGNFIPSGAAAAEGRPNPGGFFVDKSGKKICMICRQEWPEDD